MSRSKIDLYLTCPRCFYLDNKLGTARPPIPSFQINKAVDEQLKREFDVHRAKGTRHPIQEEYGIGAVPAQHPQMDEWRDNFTGVRYFHDPTGMAVSGAIDDLWVNRAGEYFIVDYKATAKSEVVTKLETHWHERYKKQIEVYQWLVRKNGLKVSDTGYFVYCTGRFDDQAFDKKIEFDVVLIPYKGNASWVEPVLYEIKECLQQDFIPDSDPDCEYCAYCHTRQNHETHQRQVLV